VTPMTDNDCARLIAIFAGLNGEGRKMLVRYADYLVWTKEYGKKTVKMDWYRKTHGMRREGGT
jgi:hypothetical protein